ncbi:MAG: hypothetical protein IKU71_01115 [Kiritimatiellae bacterium]|nr:hypothetical protein [Kiritimatiellia bacterium]
MKKLLTTIAYGISLAYIAIADVAPTNVAQIVERESGGSIVTTHKRTKKVYFVNAQSRVSGDVIETARKTYEEFIRTPIDFMVGNFDFKNPKIEGELSLYIIDDPDMPMSLVAPEGRWAFVNVAPLAKGRGEKVQFLEARVRKEIARVAGILFGGIGSNYRGNLMSLVTSPEDLDKRDSEKIPADVMMRSSGFLLGLGVRPFRHTTYRKACQEGWAPAPTNEVQKAIWDETRQLPTKPIKIEYDPAKGK